MATSSSSQSKEVLEAEVPNEIMEQFRTLQQALQQNEKLAQEFMVNTCEDDMQKLDADVERLMRILGETRADLRRERFKNHVLSERLARDSHMADLVQRRKEMLQKNPQYGRAQAIDYMHAIADEHERTLLDHESSVSRIEQTIRALSDTDADLTGMTERDLAEHIQRFDQIFAVIAAQNCAASEKVERVKEMYLEYQRKLYGRYARNPFEKRKERQKMHDAFSNLKGLDAFPSQHAVLSMSEFLPRQQAVAPMAAAPVTGFGTGSSNSLFPASKPAGSTGFGIFGQQTAANTAGVNKLPFGGAATSTTSSGANKPLFGLPSSTIATMSGFGGFSTTPASGTTSFFGNTATTSAATGTTPLFGATPAATSAGATPSLFGSATAAAPAFGSTLNSAASGTLFRGSAAGGPPTKSLFGSK